VHLLLLLLLLHCCNGRAAAVHIANPSG
jgi:hypothetical protein